jgi:hypothetical protein
VLNKLPYHEDIPDTKINVIKISSVNKSQREYHLHYLMGHTLVVYFIKLQVM